MNNLEDRANDWLAQEMRREGIVRNSYGGSGGKINAASRLAGEHTEDCEAGRIRQEHARAHDRHRNKGPLRNGVGNMPAPGRYPAGRGRRAGLGTTVNDRSRRNNMLAVFIVIMWIIFLFGVIFPSL